MALTGGIRQFNVESEPEMAVLAAVAVELGVEAPITIRVNPDVDAKTHAKIATGKSENKFGIPISRARAVYKMAAELLGLKVIGIDVHIGSQLTDLAPFEAAYQKVADLTETLRADGHKIRPSGPGRGLGIPYDALKLRPRRCRRDYGALIKRTLGHLGCEIEIEPGRLISGNAGLMVVQGDLREIRRGPRFPDYRWRDERPDPPRDVRRLPRYRAGGRTGTGGRTSQSMTSSGRFAKVAIPLPKRAICRLWRR